MATVIFFEKPGCIGNTKQKRLLLDAGHTVEPRNLLAEPWTPLSLRPFFGSRPVAEKGTQALGGPRLGQQVARFHFMPGVGQQALLPGIAGAAGLFIEDHCGHDIQPPLICIDYDTRQAGDSARSRSV